MTDRPVMLELKKLKKYFPVKRGLAIHALEDISFKIYEGEKFGVVGESGCGKSTLGRTILQLYPPTSGACIYHGKTLEEVSPKYVKREIAELLNYQKRAGEFYQKSLEVEAHIAKLDKEKDASTIAALQSRAKELRKDASRQLREGSRTVGSLILSEKLPEIAELFSLSEQESERAHAGILELAKLEAEELEERASHVASDEIARKIGECRAFIGEHIKKSQGYREKAFEYRGKHVLPITERCLDPAYQAKLDHNYERGINLGKLTGEEMRALRRDMQIVFQDPAASLDPRQTVGKAIEEVFIINTDYSPTVRREKTVALFEKVGLKREYCDYYPHQLSGGQKQRVGIARAIALDPKFVVLDESVSALDVSIQAQILLLLDALSKEKNLTYFFITHDLGVVKHFCDRILVMYLGNVCELAPSKTLFRAPLHPYTTSLLEAVPRPVVREQSKKERILEGEVPSALAPPPGCPFHTRCPKRMVICTHDKPELREIEPDHFVACHLYDRSDA
jgi:peptide/nickel transport system ATP-binding protein